MTLYYTMVRRPRRDVLVRQLHPPNWLASDWYLLQVFMLLMAEMALFMLLILPLPFAVKRRMFT